MCKKHLRLGDGEKALACIPSFVWGWIGSLALNEHCKFVGVSIGVNLSMLGVGANSSAQGGSL